jgi:hypothetical protein
LARLTVYESFGLVAKYGVPSERLCATPADIPIHKERTMKLFKPKARLSDICQKFYDTVILHPTIPGINIDLPSVYFEGTRGSIIEVDQAFSSVVQEQFVEEMIAIWFEVFGLAWLHEAGEKYVAEQSAFTKNYLDRENRPDIWEAMVEYNKAISQSATYGVTPDTAAGRMFLT